ncbi:Protein tramtrack, alpha isoform [Frankliniella fusca]|uniref:Protein tramtrack, alpha isoform n=1 Tax=Frankliniella fusca TaxID=407009 RepID=A0AAE1LIX2_9NEOP|nr:Protein tramtrack, alpha isoform [Frankliniella fusca]
MEMSAKNMKPSDNFCLKWSNYQAHVLGVLVQLLEAESLVDVTLSTVNGEKLYAHKIVLCAASSYFEEIFSDSSDSHPIVILTDVESNVLRSILDFVYHGELNVQASQLAELLEVASTLQIRGLTEVSDQLPLIAPDITSSNSIHPADASCPPCEEETEISQVAISAEEVVASHCSDDITLIASNNSLNGNENIESQEEQTNSNSNFMQGAQIEDEVCTVSISDSQNQPFIGKNQYKSVGTINREQDRKKRKRREICRKEYSEEQLAAALKDLRSGQLLGDTAIAHNIPRSTLYVRAKAEGIPITVTRQEHSGENVNAAVQAVHEGASLQQAADMYQIPKTVLWRRVKAAGAFTNRVQTRRQSYGPEHWQAAVQALQNGQNLSRVSAQFQIPKTTLFREKVRLVEAGKLPMTGVKKRSQQIQFSKQSQLKEAVAACKEGRMSQAEASITYQVPKTTIWRRLHKTNKKNADENIDSVRSVEITDATVEEQPEGVQGTLQDQAQFTFIEGNNQLPVTYIVEEDFSTAALII